ncbi:ATP dependent DNA ligase [Pyrolobus fumarii 1A]|uniref:ATP dependent DNA ligase n=1 Tax=Pyrolobus fumarii (strain DSM 11204 / 1A) TaxID=694429 RepID=G0EH99_PYRF1|nr:RNA ligase [Pyrolobus fumarii]AEM39323.1 ATP dependent DNA ligase [Pyrolobus fumarii 1A]
MIRIPLERWMIEKLAEALNVNIEEAERLARRRNVVRLMKWRNVTYFSLRKDVYGLREGTLIAVWPDGYRVVPGYPSIQRVLLPSVALPKHFIDKIVVEEKLNGYNVRVVKLRDEIVAVTRGGLICPYTTQRIRKLYGDKLTSLFREEGEELVVAGEVIGLENPYVRFYYPEAGGFAYFIFDIVHGEKFLPPHERKEIVEKHGLLHVPVLGEIDKNDIKAFRKIIEDLERRGREGVVLKDPEYRVPPLKYTTSFINIHDIEIGMRFPFDEGRNYLFSRILREIFKAVEEGWDDRRLLLAEQNLGKAILEPAIEAVKEVKNGKMLYEEFMLPFDTRDDFEEFLDYMASLGVDIIVAGVEQRSDGSIVARIRKVKDTWREVQKILETGLSPID